VCIDCEWLCVCWLGREGASTCGGLARMDDSDIFGDESLEFKAPPKGAAANKQPALKAAMGGNKK
jgi:hypothetical protein